MLFTLQKLTSDLSKVNRNHHVLDSDRPENDTEHSFAVALLCWYLHEKLQLDLDISTILKYAMVHDFVEVYAGDVQTYANKALRQQKVIDEAKAAARLNTEFSSFRGMLQALNNYEAKADDEALFVWTVDKLQALVLSYLDDWRPHKKLNISYDNFLSKYHEQLAECSPHCKGIFEAAYEYCLMTYYDKPVSS